MSLDPFEIRPGFQHLPFFDLAEDILDQVLVLYRFSCCRFPPVLPPVNVPIGDAINSVLAVGDNARVSIARDDLKGPQYCCQLCALIGLPCPA